MDITLQIQRERENPGRVYLYVFGQVLKAYELSAYILTRMFPDLEMVEEVDREKSDICYVTVIDAEFTLGNPDYAILVSDDMIEMECFLPNVIESIPVWIDEFRQLKESQHKKNYLLGRSISKV
jgi:hypothetical protein